MKFLAVFSLASFVTWMVLRAVWNHGAAYAFTAGSIGISFHFLLAAIAGFLFTIWATD